MLAAGAMAVSASNANAFTEPPAGPRPNSLAEQGGKYMAQMARRTLKIISSPEFLTESKGGFQITQQSDGLTLLHIERESGASLVPGGGNGYSLDVMFKNAPSGRLLPKNALQIELVEGSDDYFGGLVSQEWGIEPNGGRDVYLTADYQTEDPYTSQTIYKTTEDDKYIDRFTRYQLRREVRDGLAIIDDAAHGRPPRLFKLPFQI